MSRIASVVGTVHWLEGLALATILLAAGRPVAAQQADSTGALIGVVRDANGIGIVAARITVPNTPLAAVTDDSGGFRFARLPVGIVKLSVRRLGFEPVEAEALVRAVDSPILAVSLDPIAQSLAPVVVHGGQRRYVGRLADFYRRRDQETGYFLTRDEIDKRRAMRVTDMLRTIPGMRIQSDDMGGTSVRMRGEKCPPLVWLDGMPLSGGDMDPDIIPPWTIEAIEVYSGLARVPPALMGPWQRGSCGVIVIWSRDGEPGRKRKKKKDDRPVAVQLAEAVDAAAVYTADVVDSPAHPDTASQFAPDYPESLLAARVPGTVLAEFVVDTAGQADTASFSAVSSTHPLFTESVRRALPTVNFVPATLGGRLVRQVVQLPIHFQPEVSAARRQED